MKAIITLLSFFAGICWLQAQPAFENVLTAIEKNNTSLEASRRQMEARGLEHRTGIFLDNPAFEFAYLWAEPADIGPRTNLSLVQSFDFPTTYGYRNRIAEGRDEQLLAEYQKLLLDLRLEATLLCIDLVYLNAMGAELSSRVAHAREIAQAYEKMLELGETNIVEYNKARLNLLNLEQDAGTNQIERHSLLAELQRLNGGIPVEMARAVFPDPVIPADFEQWYARAEQLNPVLQWLKQEVDLSRTRERLMRAESLPGFSAGYVSEALAIEKFRGIAFGISIPLWENKNTVRHARAQTLAARELEADQKLQFYNRLKARHGRAIELQTNANRYQAGLESFDHRSLLKKALEMGEISLITYLTELSFFYRGMDQLLETERELHKAMAILNQYNP